MSIISQLQSIGAFARIRPVRDAAPGLPAYSPVADAARGDYLQARGRLLRIQRALDTLADVANIRTRFNFERPNAQSGNALALDLTNTAATLNSTEEINASPMSFTPFGPEWDGASTVPITISGEYDGSHGSGDLTFEVRWAGTQGQDDLRIRVYDPEGSRIRNTTFRSYHPLSRQVSLNNGLFISIGAGDLINRDTTRITVSDSVGSVVDPDKPLGGIRNDNPNLQYGTPAIVDGSFMLNGETINVATTDTLNDVVDRINQSNTGVTATFNAATEQIDFIQDTLGSAPTIDIQGDTSNFIEATKLDSAIVTPGIDPQTEQAIRDVPALSAISNGSILVNGESISISRANDSLSDVLDRINQSDAGVTATFNATTQRVSIESNDPEQELTLDSNGTRFFSTLSLLDGSVPATVASRGVARGRAYRIANALETLSTELSALMQDRNFTSGGANADLFRSAFTSLGTGNSGFGFKLDTTVDALRRGDFASLNRRNFTQSLQTRGDEVKEFLAGPNGDGGLINRLFGATVSALTSVNSKLGVSGTFVDTFA